MMMKCTCGNVFLMPLAQLFNAEPGALTLPCEPCEPPMAMCPACYSLWQFQQERWVKVAGVSTLHSLRLLSTKVQSETPTEVVNG